MSKPTFYITTPIYYPSANAHIGHSYCTVAADTMARYKRMRGYDVYFLTGTDEHGQKIERVADEKGVTPIEYVDEIAGNFEKLWKLMDISNDDFIRTTQPRHEKVVQHVFEKLYEQGDIYKGAYEGWYCTPCESFWTETQLNDGNCPDCGRPVEKASEEAYFLKLNKYADWLMDYIKANPNFIQPASRANEMIKNFIEPGLEDLCVSRTSFKWGIPVTFDTDHVVYVWVDALTNYISALGYNSENDELYQKYWPADIHLVGKEIVRFHTIIWPIILHALDLPQPKQIFGHGWLIIDGAKMSKSLGNVIDPAVLVNRYGLDAIRYFLLREMPFGSDGNFTNKALITRINSDLANDLGNLVHRTAAMVQKYFDGVLPADGPIDPSTDMPLRLLSMQLPTEYVGHMDRMEFSHALTKIWKFIGETNRYIDLTRPWVLAKDPEQRDRLGTVMYSLVESLRITAILLKPFLTSTPDKILDQFSVPEEFRTFKSIQKLSSIPDVDFTQNAVHINDLEFKKFGGAVPGSIVKSEPALFPRIDVDDELVALEAVSPTGEDSPVPVIEKMEEITIEDFAKVQLVTAVITAAEKIKKTKKLLKLSIDAGIETRTIVSGIAGDYSPEQLVGKRVVVVWNLKPVKLRGVLSEGMILAAEDENGKLTIISSEGATAGSSVR